jgi:arabinogalactan oligomer / maltooligosaccharide transport system permease protein
MSVDTRPGQPDTGRRSPPTSSLVNRLGGSASAIAVKLVALAVVNGLFLAAVPRMIEVEAWSMLAVAGLATLALDVIYLRRDLLPLKYLVPGTIFMLLFQAFPVTYTFYLSFTNYGAGHILTQDQAIERIEDDSLEVVGAVTYDARPVVGPDQVGALLTDPTGSTFLGTTDGLTAVDEQLPEGFEAVSLQEAAEQEDAYAQLRIPTDEGEVRLRSLTSAAVLEQTRVYDPDTGVLTDLTTEMAYTPVEGTFTADDGSTITPGWRVPIGINNYTRVFTSPEISGPFLRVFVWTFVFALLSVSTTFALGLLLAIALNKKGMRGLKTYRSLLIFPYALPSFLTALIWRGLLNESFGPVNQILATEIPWLTDPTVAKVSILLVNLWLGFPYMFIVSLGALQSIPGDMLEAAETDGATGVQRFRHVTFPLLLVSLGPLLVATFAFNFNNFNIVYLLTGGGPPIEGAQTPAGHTDILISYTYRLSFEGGQGAQYAFAAAIAVIIFMIVASLSAWGFRRTVHLEDL